MRLRLSLVFAAVSLALLVSRPARALDEMVNPRALGMGEALRGAASGGAGPLMNPSGMSLVRTYSVEGLSLRLGAHRSLLPRIDRRLDVGAQGRGRALLHVPHRQSGRAGVGARPRGRVCPVVAVRRAPD